LGTSATAGEWAIAGFHDTERGKNSTSQSWAIELFARGGGDRAIAGDVSRDYHEPAREPMQKPATNPPAIEHQQRSQPQLTENRWTKPRSP